jgi:type I restriction enzyme S subunit
MLSKSPIKAFAKVGAGQGAPQKETDFSNEGYPFIRAGHLEDLLGGKDEMDFPKVNSKIASIYRLRLYQPNTIIFAKSGMSAMKGRIYKLRNPCYVVNHLATLELSEKAFPDFVVYTLRHFSPVRLINDSSYPSLKQSTIDTYEIPFPKEISDQIRIAEILKKAENLISQRKKSIHLLDEYLKSTFLEMFGDPVRNEKDWNKLDGGNYCQKLTVGVVIKPASHYVDKGVIAIRSLNVKPNKFDLTNLVYFSKKTNETELSKSILREGDVVFVRTGVTGTSAIVPKELDGSNCIDLIITRPKIGVINAKYLTYFFNSDIGKRIVASKEVGGIQKHFNIGAIKALKIPVPPIELQNRFAQIVEKTEALKTQYQQSLEELENLYGSLSQKAFRGELSCNEEKLMMAAEPEVDYMANP